MTRPTVRRRLARHPFSIPEGDEMQKVSLLIVIAAVALVGARSATSARPTVTVRVDDSRITAPSPWPAGYVDVHIITAGKAHHHLASWHLNPVGMLIRSKASLHPPEVACQLATAVGRH